MSETCTPCAEADIRITEIGSTVCTVCGSENFTAILSNEHANGAYCVPLNAVATYTRIKRFKKYLHRAGMSQSANSIPANTWDHLMAGGPYRSPGSIVRRLKKAPKSVRKKCYDSLPLLVHLLCPHIKVPHLSERDKFRALVVFRTLDFAYCKGEPFVSYLFALEYILGRVGRGDLLPFINKISCRKRRAEYRARLNRIFRSNHCIPA